jgi:dihydropteroate synthase
MILELRACGRSHELGARPWLMGIVNATPDSFSDGGRHPSIEARVALSHELVDAGADMIDVGGESGVTNRPAVAVDDELGRVVPLIERLAAELDVPISVDTYKPAVAEAAISAGASIVNDVSGLRDVGLADVCAATGAALVVMHTAAPPKQRIQDPDLYGDVVGEVIDFLRERIAIARSHGVAEEQLIVDPGPDFTKTPAQTIELLRGADRLHELGRPVLMALSRKDFVGALTGRAPRERGPGTLAALGHGLDLGAQIFRMHDIAAAADFIAVRAALRGEADVARELRLVDELRWEAPAHRLD